MKRLSLIVPFYFEEESAPLLFERLLPIQKQLLDRQVELELIFVDDGSGDGTLRTLTKFQEQHPNTVVIKLTRNFGAWPACRAGMQHITGDCFMFLSADLQDPPELILPMVDYWLAGKRFVICERNTREDPLGAKLLSYCYYRLVRWIVVKDFPKGGYDIALMDRTMLPSLLKTSKNMSLSLMAFWLGFKPEVLYYDRPERVRGQSGWSFAMKLKFFIDSLLGFTVFPIRIMSLFGLLVSSLSAFYGLYLIIDTVFGEHHAIGVSEISALNCFLLGVVILMLGIIGEYLWRIFDELNNRPEWVIDEIRDLRSDPPSTELEDSLVSTQVEQTFSQP